MRPCYRRALILIALVLATSAALATHGLAKASSTPTRYVALGDSYSAASGVVPPDPTAPPECLRSLLNYPHLIAGQTGAQLTDVTCGGAKTSDYFSSQYTGVAPQLDALQTDTQLVTMTIGGNDSNVFIDVITDCGEAGLSTLGQGHPCEDQYGSTFDDTINTTTYPALVRALGAVHARAPHATVAILGYPWILPPSVGCFDKIPVAEGDVPYVDNIEMTLNDAISRAATATKTTFVDMSTISAGHDACQPIGIRWIEPVLQGTNPVILHPNALGEANMASQTMAVLRLGGAAHH